MSDAKLRLQRHRGAFSSLSTLIFFIVWTSTRTAPTTPATKTYAFLTTEVEQRFPSRRYCSSFTRWNSKTLRSHHLPSPSLLVLTPTVSFHSFLTSHGLSITSGNFDRKQAKTERHAHERYTPGSAKDQSTTDSGQILKCPSVP